MSEKFIKDRLIDRFLFLKLVKNQTNEQAKNELEFLLRDLDLSFITGLRVYPIWMNPDGNSYYQDCSEYENYLQYYCISRITDKIIPFIELNELGIPIVYATEDDALEAFHSYQDYYSNSQFYNLFSFIS